MTTTIRYYTVNEATCARCGKVCKHVTEIDGVQYGKVCGVKVMEQVGLFPQAQVLGTINAGEIARIISPFRKAIVKGEYIAALSAQVCNKAILSRATDIDLDTAIARSQSCAKSGNIPLTRDWELVAEIIRARLA